MFKHLLFISLFIVSTYALYNRDLTLSNKSPIYIVDFSTPNTSPIKAVFNCFKSQNIGFINLQIWDPQNGLNPRFTDNWQKAQSSGIRVEAYLSVCNNCTKKTPIEICKSIADSLPEEFTGDLLVWTERPCWKLERRFRCTYELFDWCSCRMCRIRHWIFRNDNFKESMDAIMFLTLMIEMIWNLGDGMHPMLSSTLGTHSIVELMLMLIGV